VQATIRWWIRPPTAVQTDTGVGGEVVGNYCTLNSLSSALTLVNGNLDFNKGSAADWKVAKSTFFVATGKWYWEVTVAAYSSGGQPIIFGIANDSSPLTGTDVDITAGLNGYFKDGQKRVNSTTSSYGASYTNGDVIGFAFDLDAGTLTAYKNGSSQGTLMSSITGSWTPAIGLYTGSTQLTSDSLSINFGQRPFAYTAPSGFKALCTANLPEPTIADGSTVMDVLLWTGNGSNPRSLTGLNFSPDLVWIKGRQTMPDGYPYDHTLFDTVRGASKDLRSNNTGSETTNNGYGYLDQFDSAGFRVTNGSTQDYYVNETDKTYVAWCWDAGSSTVTNTEGSITSQVRANASAGFSVVTYTGNGATASFGHGLNAAPELVIIKGRDFADSWHVYHKDVFSKYLRLNTSDSEVTNTAVYPSVPTSSVVNIGSDAGVNTNTKNLVAYCFAPVAGYSAYGSYTGNGSADGPFVYTGFRPKFVLIKRTDSTSQWAIKDSARDTYNAATQTLLPNLSNAEEANRNVDLLSNGFKWRGTDQDSNANGGTFIYLAIAESPFQYARAR
jgi:hypothetical protein